MTVLVGESVPGRKLDLRALQDRLDRIIELGAFPAGRFDDPGRQALTAPQVRPQRVDVFRAPAGMDDTEAWFLDPERQIEEPVDPGRMLGAVGADLGQEGFVLAAILFALLAVAGTQVQAVGCGVRGRPGDGIEFVVAHGGARRSRIEHVAHQLQRPKLTRAAVDKVANEDSCAGRVSPRALAVCIAKRSEQGLQPVGVTVDVSNDVVAHT